MSENSKKKKNQQVEEISDISLAKHEQDTVMVLLQQANYAGAVLRDYLLRILSANKLDPANWGVSKDYTKFEKIAQS